MLKLTSATAIITLLAFTPSFAADKLGCDEKSMMKIEMMLKEKMEMKDNTEMAMKENEKAMMAQKKGDDKDCAMHLNMAQEELMKAQ